MNGILVISLTLSFYISWAYAGTVMQGGTCSAANDYIDPIYQRFVTQCSDKMFCSAAVNGTCMPKQCRQDEFPFVSLAELFEVLSITDCPVITFI